MKNKKEIEKELLKVSNILERRYININPHHYAFPLMGYYKGVLDGLLFSLDKQTKNYLFEIK